jgi:alkaline phosphatase
MKIDASSRRTLLVIALAATSALIAAAAPALSAAKAKNVIVLIADGCSAEQYTLARWFKGAPLAFDPFQVGAVKTYIADSVIADSAPAASAYATGVRTSDKFISVGPKQETLSTVSTPPEDLRYRPLATILEGAKLMKKAAGIVATSRVTHATPAAFMAHTASRSDENDIMEQAVHQMIDVVFGGGKRHLVPKEFKGRRIDGENLFEYLKGWGYQIVENRQDMEKVTTGRVYGLFAHSHMDPEIDRPTHHPNQPTLAEMTRKAIELLDQDPDGFFLMVEASQIDWACHANDPAYMLSDLLAYEKAVQAALDFALQNGHTLVLALSDHNTGGFSIGNYASEGIYSQMKVEAFLEPFRRMKASAFAMWEMIEPEQTTVRVKSVILDNWGMNITDDDAMRILAKAPAYKDDAYYAIGEVLSPKYTYVGWTTHGHTGGDVPLHAFGPGKPSGVLDAPDIARVCAEAMGLNFEQLNRRLFVDSAKAFGDGTVTVDNADPTNLVVKIEYQGKTAELPVNKNIVTFGERSYVLEGVVVYSAQIGRAYIPQQAVNMIRGTGQALPEVTK